MKKLLIIILVTLAGIGFQSNIPTDKVWASERLKVLSKRVTIKCFITNVSSELDGDYHILVALPDSSKYLLNDENTSYQNGYLVTEIVKAHKTILNIFSKTDNKLPIPQAGDSVIITGPWVLDRIHGWNEIHPIDSITILPKISNMITNK